MVALPVSRWPCGMISVVLTCAAAACSVHTENATAHPGQDQVASATAVTAAVATLPTRETPADRYLSHIRQLAHDELGGRATGSDGIDLAAGYIAGQFAAAGLEPGGPNGTYFQEFSVSRKGEVLDETELDIEGIAIQAMRNEDFVPFGFSAKGPFSGGLAFVGYGISDPDSDHDDYADIDVTGRVVLMLRREPPGSGAGFRYSRHARFERKIALAAEKGAVAVLIANQDPGEDGIDGLMRFKPRDDAYNLPALHVKRTLADTLLDAGGLESLTELQRRLDEAGENVSAPLQGVQVSGSVAYESKAVVGRNVIGVLPGSGTRADEYVVIGGHFDHVGTKGDQVFNGADDNASGTAGVIELAWALAETPNRDRSVILMTFAGEEMGLLGSKHFAGDPTVELDSIAAMLNLDMIGRYNGDTNVLVIIGLGSGDSFDRIVTRRAREAGIEYIPEKGAQTMGGSSDHAPFYRAGVPTLFFYTGIHPDLHHPTDDWEKINAEDAARIVDLIHDIAVDIMNAEDSPIYAEVDERVPLFRSSGPRAGGVVMGIMPDMDDESEAPGWRVARVFPGGGAAEAGMKVADRILRIDGRSINGFRDYREVTSDRKPGDVIEVVVRREQEELTLEVKLSARGG